MFWAPYFFLHPSPYMFKPATICVNTVSIMTTREDIVPIPQCIASSGILYRWSCGSSVMKDTLVIISCLNLVFYREVLSLVTHMTTCTKNTLEAMPCGIRWFGIFCKWKESWAFSHLINLMVKWHKLNRITMCNMHDLKVIGNNHQCNETLNLKSPISPMLN